MDFTVDNAISILLIISGLIGIYSGFKTQLTVLEREVSDLRELVSELRLDIKALISKN